jgi:hypothetical protein
MDHDPLKAPEPEERLALDEEERMQIVEDYHRRAGADFRRRADPNQSISPSCNGLRRAHG